MTGLNDRYSFTSLLLYRIKRTPNFSRSRYHETGYVLLVSNRLSRGERARLFDQSRNRRKTFVTHKRGSSLIYEYSLKEHASAKMEYLEFDHHKEEEHSNIDPSFKEYL